MQPWVMGSKRTESARKAAAPSVGIATYPRRRVRRGTWDAHDDDLERGDLEMSWPSARVAGSVLAAVTATLGVAAPAYAGPHKEPGVGTSAMVSCGLSYPAKDNQPWVNFPANTVTMRSGPSNSCIQTGQGLHDQRAQYLCYTPGDGGTWTYLRNTATGDQGWVRDDLLPKYGSNVPCEDNPPPATVRPA